MIPARAISDNDTDIDQLAINTIRTLAIDGVQKANSGHPGTPLGAAPTAYTLWQSVLRYDPQQPGWPNRDRFVLSSGHASILLYALIHLAGIKAEKPSLQRPRPPRCDPRRHQDVSPGRAVAVPVIRNTVGPRASRAPLARSVRASRPAWEWRSPALGWPRPTTAPDFDLFDFNVYALCGDGDMMEGISSEAASLAGHLKLSEPVLDL